MEVINEYRERTRKTVLQKLNSLLSVETYLGNKKLRQDLAGLYKQVKSLGNGFPSASFFQGGISDTLMKSVSNSCSSCVSTSRMKKEIETALLHLEKYKILLLDGKESETTIEPPKTIHELRPNI